jgi:glucose/mannose-6-phosphate isomerase
MNLDDTSRFQQIDTQDMLSHVDGLPDQLTAAWELGSQLPLPNMKGIERVVVAGMGGSAIGADLVIAYITPFCSVPVFLHRNYALPAWASGSSTLMIASSHSGNTEETISSFDSARENGCQMLAFATGGKLAQLCASTGTPLWQFEHHGQPRAAVGFSAGLLLAALSRLELIPDQAAAVADAAAAMQEQQTALRADVPTSGNLAKRLAGQIYGRWTLVVGADLLEPVARRWKSQINEIGKAWGQFEAIPELDHNSLAGLVFPQEALTNMMALFLRAPAYHARNQLRSELTKTAFMVEGVNTDFIDALGDNPLAQQWTALHLGDYTAYYLAMAYEIDPTAIPNIEMFKGQITDMN